MKRRLSDPLHEEAEFLIHEAGPVAESDDDPENEAFDGTPPSLQTEISGSSASSLSISRSKRKRSPIAYQRPEDIPSKVV